MLEHNKFRCRGLRARRTVKINRTSGRNEHRRHGNGRRKIDRCQVYCLYGSEELRSAAGTIVPVTIPGIMMLMINNLGRRTLFGRVMNREQIPGKTNRTEGRAYAYKHENRSKNRAEISGNKMSAGTVHADIVASDQGSDKVPFAEAGC